MTHSILRRVRRKVGRIAVKRARVVQRPLRIAIIGCGGIGPDHIEAYDHLAVANVVAVSDLLPQALASALNRMPRLRAYVNYSQMLKEIQPDIVHVCTWPQSHGEIVINVARSGVKGILCEKPLALRLDEMETMISVCSEHGVRLAGGHQYRFHANYMRARQIIRDGRLGRLTEVHGNIASTLANNGPHLIDTVRFLLGDAPITHVECTCTREKKGFNRGFPAEESARGYLQFEQGVRFEFCTGESSPTFFGIRMEGKDGWLEVSPEAIHSSDPRLDRSGGDPVYRERQFKEFVRWVKGKASHYSADGEQSMRTAEAVLALYQSAGLGAAQALPLTSKGDVIRHTFAIARDDAELNTTRVQPPRLGVSIPGDQLCMNGGPRAVRSWFSTGPCIGLAEFRNTCSVLLSKQLGSTDGRWVRMLEERCADLYGAPRAVASTSGTAALHVAMAALNPEPGDEVITTPISDMGTIIPILACNCVPVFADVDPLTGNLTPETIAKKITPRTKAAIVVHLFGRPVDLDPICKLLRDRNIALIEDCAQAHLAVYKGKKVGTFGDLGCFSLQQSKQITCGDGGFTLVNRKDLIERASLFVDKGWDRTGGSRAHKFLGMNYRMTELQGAVAVAQLQRLPDLIESRRQSAEKLRDLLRHLRPLRIPQAPADSRPAWWIFHFNVDEASLGVSTSEFCDAINVEGVRAKVGYLPRPLFLEEMLVNRNTYGTSGYPLMGASNGPQVDEYPGANEFLRRSIVMSWSSGATGVHAHDIARAVEKVLNAIQAVASIKDRESNLSGDCQAVCGCPSKR